MDVELGFKINLSHPTATCLIMSLIDGLIPPKCQKGSYKLMMDKECQVAFVEKPEDTAW
jgi:hypothetical protein